MRALAILRETALEASGDRDPDRPQGPITRIKHNIEMPITDQVRLLARLALPRTQAGVELSGVVLYVRCGVIIATFAVFLQ